MKDHINLNSTEWCDIIFQNKNKEYGAYAMRQTSDKFHLIAFGIMLVIATLIATLPMFLNSVKEIANKSEGYTEGYQVSIIDIDVAPKAVIPIVSMPEIPKRMATIIFVPPVIVEDNLISEGKEMKTMDDLIESPLAISHIDNPNGSLDKDAVPPELVALNNVITDIEIIQKPFETVAIMPKFQGGEAEMYKYINNHLRYPVSAQENGIQGRVTVRFVVNKTGQIEDAVILKGIDVACDAEALRVVKSMPRWVAGKQNGESVAVYFTLPIVFRLQR